jgi:hypothetical protein
MSSFRTFSREETSPIVVMDALMNTETDLALFREDLFNLKRDVVSRIEDMKGGATNTV